MPLLNFFFPVVPLLFMTTTVFSADLKEQFQGPWINSGVVCQPPEKKMKFMPPSSLSEDLGQQILRFHNGKWQRRARFFYWVGRPDHCWANVNSKIEIHPSKKLVTFSNDSISDIQYEGRYRRKKCAEMIGKSIPVKITKRFFFKDGSLFISVSDENSKKKHDDYYCKSGGESYFLLKKISDFKFPSWPIHVSNKEALLKTKAESEGSVNAIFQYVDFLTRKSRGLEAILQLERIPEKERNSRYEELIKYAQSKVALDYWDRIKKTTLLKPRVQAAKVKKEGLDKITKEYCTRIEFRNKKTQQIDYQYSSCKKEDLTRIAIKVFCGRKVAKSARIKWIEFVKKTKFTTRSGTLSGKFESGYYLADYRDPLPSNSNLSIIPEYKAFPHKKLIPVKNFKVHLKSPHCK